MTKDKFQILCDRILIPRVGDLMHSQLAPVHDTLDIMARELARIEAMLKGLAVAIHDRHAEDRHVD